MIHLKQPVERDRFQQKNSTRNTLPKLPTMITLVYVVFFATASMTTGLKDVWTKQHERFRLAQWLGFHHSPSAKLLGHSNSLKMTTLPDKALVVSRAKRGMQ